MIKKITKLGEKLITIFTASAMLLSSIPVGALTFSDNPQLNELYDYAVSLQEPTILGEVEEKRGINEKHFFMSDGTFKVAIYPHAVHYEEDGKFIEYDNTLVEKDGFYVPRSNDVDIKLSKNTSSEIITFSSAGHTLKWGMRDISSNSSAKISKQRKSDANQMEVNDVQAEVKYERVFSSIDITYDVVANTVEEFIHINNAYALKYEFTYDLEVKDLAVKQLEKNVLAFVDSKGKEIFYITAPIMYDASFNFSDGLKLIPTKTDNGYTIKLELDKEWLDDVERVYPIVVDPVIGTTPNRNEIKDTFIYPSDSGNTGRGNAHILRVGSTSWAAVGTGMNPFRSLIQFPLPPLNSGDQVIAAELNIFNYHNDGLWTPPSGTLQMDIHKINKSWTETGAAWAGMKDAYEKNVIDYFKYSYSTSSPNKENIADITSVVKDWYTNGGNYGIMLKENVEAKVTGRNDASFVSSDTSGAYTAKRPYIVIQYFNQTGLEGYMAANSQNIGRTTTHINNYNGNLTLIHPSASTPGNRLPASIYHVFNTNDRFTSTNNTNIGYGQGFRLNLNQTLEVNKPGSIDYLEYIDEDATRHYFYKDGNTWVDESGLDLKIAGNTTSNPTEYYMTDKDGNKSTFIKNGTKWYLRFIDDTNGNRITINYNTSNYNLITSVVDGSGDTLTLAYSASKLIRITDPSGRQITFDYTANGSTHTLSSVTYPDGEVTTFGYNANLGLHRVTDVDGSYVNYAYTSSSPYRVRRYREYSPSGTAGNAYDMRYGHNTTTIIDEKGPTYTYSFNNLGQTTSITDLGDKGIVSDAYGIAYEYGTTGGNTNKLILETPLIKSTNNFLVNNSFENNLTNWVITQGGTVNGTVEAVTNDKHMGSKSLRMTSTSLDSYPKLYQQYNKMENGKTYTFSAYIKGTITEKLNTTTSGVTMYLSYQKADGVYYGIPCFMDITNNWERYSCTFTIPKDAVGNRRVVLALRTAKGTVYYDNAQLEEGEIANPYNLVENGNFSNGEISWGNRVGINTKDKVVTIDGTTSFVLTGELKAKNVGQYIDIPVKKGDSFSVSYWGKNLGVPTNGTKHARLLIEFVDSAGSLVQKTEFPILADSSSWQYVSGEVVANADYQRIKVTPTFNQNVGNIYYTNIGVFKDEGSNSYTYDENGNVISVSNLANQNSSMKYNSNNQLSMSINPKGRKFYYEYDYLKKDRLLSASNQNGLTHTFEYDNYGNVISNKISESNTIRGVSQIVETVPYYIKPINSNLYVGITGTNVQLKNTPQEWYFHSLGNDEFSISNSSNQRIEVIGGVTTNNTNLGVASPVVHNRQTFKLVSNNDGTFSLQTKITNFDRCMNVQASEFILNKSIQQATCSSNSLSQTYQIIQANPPKVKYIESKAEYSTDGRYQTKIIDERDKATTFDYNLTRGTLSSVTNAKNQTTNYTYDTMDKVTSISSGNTTNSYTYDKDRLSTITHNNFNYSFVYDEFGNTTNIRVGTQNLITNIYGPVNGFLTKSTYGNGHTVDYTYDQFGRVNTKTNSVGTASFLYNNRGNLAKTNYNDIETNYTYDLSGRISSLKQNANYTINYQYDEYNNISSIKYNLGNIAKTTNYTYDSDDKITNLNEYSYTYDKLDRLSTKKINNNYTITYNYLNVNSNKTTSLIETINNNGTTFKYEYDNLGNITRILKNNVEIVSYTYNALNQLFYEDNAFLNRRIVYAYDNYGNITSKQEYPYKVISNLISIKSYSYGNSNWKDQLTNHNGNNITYDTIGNPLTYGTNIRYTWQNGRELATYADISKNLNVSYKYNENGIRTEKTVNGLKHEYFLEGSDIIFEKRGNDTIYYFYDESGVAGFEYQGAKYYYVKNLQGDIIEILNSNNQVVASYMYDAWGIVYGIHDGQGNDVSNNLTHIANINPYRYRGYYYDIDTQLYYLNSRYYNPEIGRFINVDGYYDTGTSTFRHNMYTYVDNNPVNKIDPSGTIPKFFNYFFGPLVKTFLKKIIAANKQNKSVTNTASSNKSNGNNDWLDTKGEPNTTLPQPNGDERTYGPDGLALRDTDWSHPQRHPDLSCPHNHDWTWPNGPDGDPARGPAHNWDTGRKVVTTGMIIYGGYLFIKWGVAITAAPATGGGSLIIAGATP